MSETSAPKGGLLLPLIGFLIITGSFGAGVVLSFHDRHPDTAKTEETAPEDAPILVYYPLGEPVQVTLTGVGTVLVGLSLALQGHPAELLELQEVAKAREPELRAAVSEAGQAEADVATDADGFRHGLPVRLRDSLNQMIGTEALPAPVVDVLLVSFVVR